MTAPKPCEPFLKWPGGKRWAAARIATLVDRHLGDGGTYFEPFLGGGAVFFHRRPVRAVLGDINGDLISVYDVVRDSAGAVLQVLRQLSVSSADYYRIRDARPRTAIQRAARFLYLNRTAFGGIYRLNREGHFNVPYGGGGRTPAALWEKSLLTRAAEALTGAELVCGDFAPLMRRAERGDVVYCDPTYTVAHDNNGFIRYNERNFSWNDQIRLAQEATLASRRGATVIISNAHHLTLRDLYRRAHVHVLRRTSRVSTVATARGPVAEYLFVLNRDSPRVPTRPRRVEQSRGRSG